VIFSYFVEHRVTGISFQKVKKSPNIKPKQNEQNPPKSTKQTRERRKSNPPDSELPPLPQKTRRGGACFVLMFSVFFSFYASANSVQAYKLDNIWEDLDTWSK